MMQAPLRLLLDLVDEAFDRKAWHGTTLLGSIRGVPVGTAAWRPAPGRHNIWELTVHAGYRNTPCADCWPARSAARSRSKAATGSPGRRRRWTPVSERGGTRCGCSSPNTGACARPSPRCRSGRWNSGSWENATLPRSRYAASPRTTSITPVRFSCSNGFTRTDITAAFATARQRFLHGLTVFSYVVVRLHPDCYGPPKADTHVHLRDRF